MKNRVEYKLDLLQMEGQGFNRAEIVEQLAEKYNVSKRLGYYYFKTRARWQPEILGLEDAKDSYHQTLNRLEYIYRRFSILSSNAPEASNRVGALKGMLEALRTKAEVTGVLGPSSQTTVLIEDGLDSEVFNALTPEENALVMCATDLFLKKKQGLATKTSERQPL
jgi:hypothetical protein